MQLNIFKYFYSPKTKHLASHIPLHDLIRLINQQLVVTKCLNQLCLSRTSEECDHEYFTAAKNFFRQKHSTLIGFYCDHMLIDM